MKIAVRVKPGARREEVIQKEEELVVAVRARAADGKANDAVVKAVARHFGVAASRVRILRGLTGREKLIEITE